MPTEDTIFLCSYQLNFKFFQDSFYAYLLLMKGTFILLLSIASLTLCGQGVDSLRLMNDLRELSSDRYQGDDRTFRGDHAVFHLAGIPFLYFGVPEHLNYHQTTDDYENVSHSFYFTGVNLILKTIVQLDKDFPVIKKKSVR